MEKLSLLYKKATSVNYAYLLILGLVVKSLVDSISYPDFLITIPVLSFEAYKLYLKSKKPDPVMINAEVQKELDGLKGKLNLINMEKNVQSNQPKRYF